MKNNIKAARESQGLTQQECAELFNVKLRAWQTYEQGVSEPKFEVLCKIADKFGVTTDYLLGRPDAKQPDDPVELLAAQYKLGTAEHAIIASYLALPQEDRTKLVDIVEQIAKKAEEKKPEITVEKTQYKQVSSSEGDKIFPTTEKPPGIEEQLLKTQPTDEDL
nr:MAG TPA: helix-turn-helix domain protein [Caudoviricetes sp.]